LEAILGAILAVIFTRVRFCLHISAVARALLFTFFNCMAAHSGVSGIFHKAILPLASPLIKYFIHLPSFEKMRYLKAGGQCNAGLGTSMASSQKSKAVRPPPTWVLDLFSLNMIFVIIGKQVNALG
jgi:hypothetical protein